MLAIFLDLETTGLDIKRHRVLELAFQILDMRKGQTLRSYERIIQQPKEVWDARDPVSIRINGFSWEALAGGIPEPAVADEVLHIFTKLGINRDNTIYICQNPSFDRTFFSQLIDTYLQEELQWPYHWLDLASMYWAKTMQSRLESNAGYPDHLQLSKDSIAQTYGLPPEEKPHRALNGVKHLVQCYQAVVGP